MLDKKFNNEVYFKMDFLFLPNITKILPYYYKRFAKILQKWYN